MDFHWSTSEYEDLSESVEDILPRDTRGRIAKNENNHVYIYTPGGDSFWVKEEKLIYRILIHKHPEENFDRAYELKR